MVKIIVAFISLFLIFFFGIDLFRRFTLKEKISLTKWAGYSMLCTLLTTLLVVTIAEAVKEGKVSTIIVPYDFKGIVNVK